MTTDRPDRFNIPGLSPERKEWLDDAFGQILGSIPKPVDPKESVK